MSYSIGCACNFYNEANALPGFLESASAFFDDIVMINAGPGGARSDDGSIEIIEKWGARLEFDTIDDGFGALRTRIIRLPQTEWTMIMDADERFHRWAPQFYPQVGSDEPTILGTYDQGAALRDLLCLQEVDVIVTMRRHWHDFSWRRPTQNFFQIPDWQGRILRNNGHVGFTSAVKMHEQLCDFRTNGAPRCYQPGIEDCLVHHDHYHCPFKKAEREQRLHDIAIYDALHEGKPLPTAAEFRASYDPGMEERISYLRPGRTMAFDAPDYDSDGEGQCLPRP